MVRGEIWRGICSTIVQTSTAVPHSDHVRSQLIGEVVGGSAGADRQL